MSLKTSSIFIHKELYIIVLQKTNQLQNKQPHSPVLSPNYITLVFIVVIHISSLTPPALSQ